MYSQTVKGRTSKGSVSVLASNGRLQLRFHYAGKRHYLSLGIPDTKNNRKAAEAKAKLIESDIAFDRFDPTLAKYKPQSALSTVTPSITPLATPKPELSELWAKYEVFKKPQVSQSTYAVDYRKYRNHIAGLPSKNLENAIAIRDYLTANLTLNAARRVLTNINACCDWALKSQLIDNNPFGGMASEVKIPKSDADETEINPFTRTERDAIIQAFEESKLYSYYAPLVKFLFFTGCRPSEAIALQWRHINDKFITFEQALTISTKGLSLKEGLKTQGSRRFPINNQVRAILDPIRPEKNKSDELIFKSKQSGYIDFGDFLSHAWRGYKNRHGKQIDGIVTQLVRQGIVSEYRKPYQCRHTFITLCLESDIDAKDVAKWVGNSPEVIYRHYAGNKRDLQVPEL
jgi:integrase